MSKKNMWHRKSSGLSLFDLLLTLAVAGVLVTVAIPTFNAYSRLQGKIQCQASVIDFLRAQELYYLDNKNFYPLLPGEKTSDTGKVVEIAWNLSSRPTSANKYFFPELAMGFQADNHRGYRIQAINVQTNERFNQTLIFSLRTNEGFHNDGQWDYEYKFKLFNRQDTAGPTEWSSHGQWMVRNSFWFDILGCPAWRWTPACQR